MLVADDLPQVLSAVAALLRDSFDIVGMVSDGQAALVAILTLKPDLAVMGISMPIMSGIEVARELKSRANKTKIVFLTVQEDSDIIATCLSAGALGYVVKEVMNGDLILAMNEALEQVVYSSRVSLPSKEMGRQCKNETNVTATFLGSVRISVRTGHLLPNVQLSPELEP